MNLSSRWEEHQEGGAGGATATKTAEQHRQYWALAIAGHTDKNSLVQIIDGTNVVWEIYIDVSQGSYFNEAICIPGTRNTDMKAKVVNSTNDCFISLTGFTAFTGDG
jgi:hypothetical protein